MVARRAPPRPRSSITRISSTRARDPADRVSRLLLALGASLAWGVADFVGPWQGRTLGLSACCSGRRSAASRRVDVGRVAGQAPADGSGALRDPGLVSGTLGLYAYYRGVGIGAMAVVAPIAGVSAIVPVVFGILTAITRRRRSTPGSSAPSGVGLASQEHQAGGRAAWPPGWARASRRARVRVLLPADACRRQGRPVLGRAHLPHGLDRHRPRRGRRSQTGGSARGWKLLIVLGVGLGDTLGNVLFGAAAGQGGLESLTSVLASLYPVVTVHAGGDRSPRAGSVGTQRLGAVLASDRASS